MIASLRTASAYPHSVMQIEVIETHISWIVLTGEHVYKIKKPVNFGFLDFSTLARRKHYCEEELRLNRRFAPALYLDVVAITGEPPRIQVGGEGKAIEYAVHMRQFHQQDLLDRYAADRRLDGDIIDAMCDVVTDFHAGADRYPPDPYYGSPACVKHWTEDNFQQIRSAVTDLTVTGILDRLEQSCRQMFGQIRTLLETRRRQGQVRECHGDLHLGNMALIDGRVTPFDCIEFNPQLRWIDVINEIAFVGMDLAHRDYPHLTWRFFNRYFQTTGDYEGLALLRYFVIYRALVRAKVEALRLTQLADEAQPSGPGWQRMNHYLNLAQRWAGRHEPALILLNGLSGSGKSTLARAWADQLGAIRLVSDIERKRLFGLKPDATSDSDLNDGIYSRDASEQTYARLRQLAQQVIAAGLPVLVDASFLRRAERESFRLLAARLSVPFRIVQCHAPEPVLRQRIIARQAAGTDPSEADVAVLERQLQTHDPLNDEEKPFARLIDTSDAASIQAGLSDEMRNWLLSR